MWFYIYSFPNYLTVPRMYFNVLVKKKTSHNKQTQQHLVYDFFNSCDIKIQFFLYPFFSYISTDRHDPYLNTSNFFYLRKD